MGKKRIAIPTAVASITLFSWAFLRDSFRHEFRRGRRYVKYKVREAKLSCLTDYREMTVILRLHHAITPPQRMICDGDVNHTRTKTIRHQLWHLLRILVLASLDVNNTFTFRRDPVLFAWHPPDALRTLVSVSPWFFGGNTKIVLQDYRVVDTAYNELKGPHAHGVFHIAPAVLEMTLSLTRSRLGIWCESEPCGEAGHGKVESEGVRVAKCYSPAESEVPKSSQRGERRSVADPPILYILPCIVCKSVLPIMSVYESFAVAGAGVIGAPIVKELVQLGVQTQVLTRAGLSKSFETGVEVREVNYEDEVRSCALSLQDQVGSSP
jgi:hypothetical protein